MSVTDSPRSTKSSIAAVDSRRPFPHRGAPASLRSKSCVGVGALLGIFTLLTAVRNAALFRSGLEEHDQWTLSGLASAPPVTSTDITSSKPKFAVVSGFVTKESKKRPRVDDKFLPHLLNKACYCELWGYDYIFNQTWGFPDEIRSPTTKSGKGAHWLDYGTWHRVPHMVAAMDAGYEWVLYADVDYIFQDMMLPLESFLKQWEHHGKQNVHVFLPDDDNTLFTFSAFAVMIRNSDFGRKLLQNWLKFAHGVCPNSNFPTTPGKCSWTDSDQPSLWCALAQTHHDFCPEQGGDCNAKCTEEAHLNATRVVGPELNVHMRKVGAAKEADLSKVPDGKV